MESFTHFLPPTDFSRPYHMQKTYKTLDEALSLVKNAVQGEREDEVFYDYLISVAPTQEEKNILASIRDDERKHNKYFREIYIFYTKQNLPTPANVNFEKPKSYIDGIVKAKFGELTAMERYRDIKAGLTTEYYKDMVFEILTDELKHAHKYDYILYLSLRNKANPAPLGTVPSTTQIKIKFTPEEAAQIARLLGIDFSKERFDLEQFRMGLDVELEHGLRDPSTNVTDDDPILTGKIALAHLNEFPDYYTRLSKLEDEAIAYWSTMRGIYRQTREFTLAELSEYDGSMGRPAYIAVDGIVYDVSNEATWGGATHFGLVAGRDLTAEFKSCHGMAQTLRNLPKVGILRT
jgi:predicted heme/steroid binding protein/rubrerythrin